MLNAIWLALVLGSVLCAAFTGRMEALQKATIDGAKSAVDLVIGLVGVMALFLGLMRVARDGGLLDAVTRALRPLMRRLFPDVPEDHPAMGAMIMNLASNVLGLGNAATPFGLKAMRELARLGTRPGVATDAMVLFLAINATSISILPTGTVGVRAAAGSANPFSIFLPTLLATTASTLTAIAFHFLLRGRARYAAERFPIVPAAIEAPADEPALPAAPVERAAPSTAKRLVIWGFVIAFVAALLGAIVRAASSDGALAAVREVSGTWMLSALVATLVLVGWRGGAKVYESAVEGAREALEVSVRIVPFLVVILTAVAMFRASGLLDVVIGSLDPVTGALGVPAEALPMAILRPLSGSGAFGVMSEILKTHGPDSFIGVLVSTYQGSTETTFYVLAVYLGAAGVREGRHALACCLMGDLVGFAVATAACHLFFA